MALAAMTALSCSAGSKRRVALAGWDFSCRQGLISSLPCWAWVPCAGDKGYQSSGLGLVIGKAHPPEGETEIDPSAVR